MYSVYHDYEFMAEFTKLEEAMDYVEKNYNHGNWVIETDPDDPGLMYSPSLGWMSVSYSCYD